MAIGDIHDLNLQGQFCGVPISIGMAYLQLEADEPGVTSGRRLIDQWFNTTVANGGPWHIARLRLTTDLVFECATDSWGNFSVAEFLIDARGENDVASTPSPICAQINIPALEPHHLQDQGRFFLPGLAAEDTLRSGYGGPLRTMLQDFCVALVELDDPAGPVGPRYHLIPHAKYRDILGANENTEAFTPYPSPFLKVLNSRRSDACTAFVGGGLGFDPIITIPSPP